MQSVESVLNQPCLVAAPPVVGFVVGSRWPAAAPILAAAAVIGGAGAMWGRHSRPVAAGADAARSTVPARRPATGRLVAVFALITGTSMVSGVYNVAAAARFGSGHGSVATPGTVIGAAALGSVVGGLLYPRLQRRIGLAQRYPVLAAFWAAGLWLLAAAPNPVTVLAAAAVSGLPIAGLGAEEFSAVGRISGRRSPVLYGLANTL
ncbi:hypothetical protein ACIA5C_00445 [Actinoplanes sp. NPDC051343]|uniref:hypothetical protein n=1 Tax=Actinoplanes sp. NPDC051343 TaxID=3363906 RepID=UPI0037A807BF